MVRLNYPALLAALAPLASAWSISFYTGQRCNEDSSFNNANYEGTGKSACIPIGDPSTDRCIWYTDNAGHSGPCTAPMNPIGSLQYTPTANCYVGWSSSCEYGMVSTLWAQFGDRCVNASAFQNLPDPNSWPLSFYCEDI